MGKNTRYIKTEVDNTPKILHLLSCNLCPLLTYDDGPKVSRCAKYHSITTNITDNNIYSYSAQGDCTVPIKQVDIPDWCGLSEGESLVKATGDMFVKDGHNSYKIVHNIYQNLVVMSGLCVDYDVKLMKLVSGSNKNAISFSYNRNRALPERTTTYSSNPTPTPPVPTLRTCSCCGELLEDVSRKKNFGMCPTCWEKHKDDKKVKEFAFINNFRLKRAATWTDESYKKIKEID